MTELDKASGFSDEELEALFSAFGELSAPETLKASTLGLIASLPAAAGAGSAVATPEAVAEQPTSATEPAPAQTVVTATAGGKAPRPRPRARGFRAAAIAACLTLVVTGGAAYATPVSVVTITQGDASVELGVNLFGMAVSATSDDEGGRSIVDSNNLVHVSYSDALSRVAVALDAAGGGELELVVQSPLNVQREQLERHNQAFLSDRGDSAAQQNGRGGDDARPSRGSSGAADSAGNRPVGDVSQDDGSDGGLPSDEVLPGGGLASFDQPSPGGLVSTPVTPTPSDPGSSSDDEDDPGADDPGADDPGADDPGADDPGSDDPGSDDPGSDDPAFGWVAVDDEPEPDDPSDGGGGLPGEDDDSYDFSPISSGSDPVPDPPNPPDPPIILVSLGQSGSVETDQGSVQDPAEEHATQLLQDSAEESTQNLVESPA